MEQTVRGVEIGRVLLPSRVRVPGPHEHDSHEFVARLMEAMVDELGGAESAARRLRQRHRISPIEFAIERLGGKIDAAEQLGISRPMLYHLLGKGPEAWNLGKLRLLSQLSKISMDILSEPMEEDDEPVRVVSKRRGKK